MTHQPEHDPAPSQQPQPMGGPPPTEYDPYAAPAPQAGPPPMGPMSPGGPPQPYPGAPQPAQPQPAQPGQGVSFAVPQGAASGMEARLLWGAIVGAGIMVLSAFLPWVSVLGLTVYGIQGDGWFVLLPGLAAGVFAFLRIPNASEKLRPIVFTVVGALGALITLIALIRLASMGSSDFLGTKIAATPGIGLILGLLASLAVAGIGIYALVKKIRL